MEVCKTSQVQVGDEIAFRSGKNHIHGKVHSINDDGTAWVEVDRHSSRSPLPMLVRVLLAGIDIEEAAE